MTDEPAAPVLKPDSRTSPDTSLMARLRSEVNLPIVFAIAAIGIFLIALADNSARAGRAWGPVLYWAGLFLLYAPIVSRLLLENVTRRERITLLLALGLGFYLVKLFYSPLEFKFPDELQHYRTLYEILRTGHLFSPNSALPVSPYYPGLESVTTAFIKLSGLPIFESGVIVMAVSRVLLTLALFCAYERISESHRIAGIASALYMANPHYLFVNSFYIYQSLAIALTAFGLYTIAKGDRQNPREMLGYKLIFLMTFAAVVFTHHFTSYVMLFLLLVWLLSAVFTRRRDHESILTRSTWVLGLVGITGWIGYVAKNTVDYFERSILSVISDVMSLLNGQEGLSEIFQAPSGALIERAINMGVVGMIAACLLPAWWYTWRRYRDNSLAMILLIGSLTYYGSIVLRVVSSQGAEFAGRSWSFVFLMMAFVMAVGVEEVWKRWLANRAPLLIFTVFMCLMLLGGIIGGWPPAWERLPGPYQAGAFESSVEAMGTSAAKWMLAYLGPGNRIASDFVNYTLMGSYGQQEPVRGVYRILYAEGQEPEDIQNMVDYAVDYLVVDKRLSRYLPASGRYFDSIDPMSYRYTRPIDLAALTKFDRWNDVFRIYDSGEIVIYDVQKLEADQ
jgi:hypothetical protein